jgi:hypothetical protein
MVSSTFRAAWRRRRGDRGLRVRVACAACPVACHASDQPPPPRHSQPPAVPSIQPCLRQDTAAHAQRRRSLAAKKNDGNVTKRGMVEDASIEVRRRWPQHAHGFLALGKCHLSRPSRPLARSGARTSCRLAP